MTAQLAHVAKAFFPDLLFSSVFKSNGLMMQYVEEEISREHNQNM